jgi:serine protease Do
MNRFTPLLLPSLLVFMFAARATAETPTTEQIARSLTETAVTVRMAVAAAPSARPAGEDQSPAPAEESVTVCTGASLGKGLIVSALSPVESARYRITLTGGEQAEAELRVADEYSTLALLETKRRDLPALELAEKPSQVGARLLAAAAWGVEPPVVSMGILSGVDRSLPGASLPPLWQCDLRGADTSRGGPIVDHEGKLAAIVVAGQEEAGRGGWLYAVDAGYVRRLLEAKQDGKAVTLGRRRPVVGLVLMQGEQAGTVQVQRVAPDGPAAKAGVEPGDVLVSVDGAAIRSAYEAIGRVNRRQPGQQVQLVVQRGEQEKTVDVLLGGLPAVESNEPESAARIAGGAATDPAVNMRRVGPEYQIQRGQGQQRSEVELLEEASARYLQLIGRQLQLIGELRDDLRRRDEQIQSLQSEIDALRRQIEPPADKAPAP